LKQLLLPGTDLSISQLSFGTARLHRLFGSTNRQHILTAAADLGFTHFDTAPLYGFGLAEQELGRSRALRRHGNTVASKVGLYPPGGCFEPEIWLRKLAGKGVPVWSRPIIDWTVHKAELSLERSLKALNRDVIDILFLHEPDPAVLNSEELLQWLERQQRLGKIRYWGLAGDLSRLSEYQLSKANRAVLQTGMQTLRNKEFAQQSHNHGLLIYGVLGRHVETSEIECTLQSAIQQNPNSPMLVSSGKVRHLSALIRTVELLDSC